MHLKITRRRVLRDCDGTLVNHHSTYELRTTISGEDKLLSYSHLTPEYERSRWGFSYADKAAKNQLGRELMEQLFANAENPHH